MDHFNAPRESHSNVPVEIAPTSPSSPHNQPPSHTPGYDSITFQSPVPSPPSQISQPPMQATSSTLQATPSSSQAPPSSSSISSRKAKRSRGHPGSDDDVGRVIQFINSNKNKKELDVTDNLFLSYADTFKKFPPREQAIVKLEMAKLFSNIELRLLDDTSYNPLQTSISMASPAYSNISSVNNTNQESPAPQPINLSGDNNANVGEENFIFEFL